MDRQLESIEQVRNTLIDLALRFGPRVLAALLILTVGFFIGRAVAGWMTRGLSHIEMEPPVRLLLVRVTRVLVMMLFVIMALQNLGVELLPLVAGLGIAGAGIALAMQGLLGNVFAGLSIIFSKPFRVGEYISIVGEEGRVETITLFSTTLSHPDRSYVVIPNRKIAGEILHNYGKTRQVSIVVGVSYDTDLRAALDVVSAILQKNPRVLRDPAPSVVTSQLAESAINITVGPWVNVEDLSAATSEINQEIIQQFRQREISVARPRRDVRLVEMKAAAQA
jgi:small conductance mechanosensitive channel